MSERKDMPELPTLAWRWVPSEIWGEYVVTCRLGDAIMARETGKVEVEELVSRADALAYAEQRVREERERIAKMVEEWKRDEEFVQNIADAIRGRSA